MPPQMPFQAEERRYAVECAIGVMVRGLATGAASAVAALEDACRRGPPSAVAIKIDVNPAADDGAHVLSGAGAELPSIEIYRGHLDLRVAQQLLKALLTTDA